MWASPVPSAGLARPAKAVVELKAKARTRALRVIDMVSSD